MTMPKKGLRKVTVDGKEYKYVVKPPIKYGPSSNGGLLTVEIDNLYYSTYFNEPITPLMVTKFIKDRPCRNALLGKQQQ